MSFGCRPACLDVCVGLRCRILVRCAGHCSLPIYLALSNQRQLPNRGTQTTLAHSCVVMKAKTLNENLFYLKIYIYNYFYSYFRPRFVNWYLVVPWILDCEAFVLSPCSSPGGKCCLLMYVPLFRKAIFVLSVTVSAWTVSHVQALCLWNLVVDGRD